MSDAQSSLAFNQIVLLDRHGHVKYSCNSLIQLQHSNQSSIIPTSPFLESVFPQVMKRSLDNKALRYYRLENPFPGLTGTYDFSFKWVEVHDGKFILWNIYDLSELYEGIKKAQQLRNEYAISTERLEQISRKDFENWNKNGR